MMEARPPNATGALQSFDDDRSARRWIEQHEQSILDELKRAR